MELKRRLIYADEDAQALRGLQRHARALKAGWDIAFVDHGQAVLQALEADGCDVLIASGSLRDIPPELLFQNVIAKAPGCVRIMLTGTLATDRVMPCVGLLHQAYPRTSDPHKVLAMIANAQHVSDGLSRHPEMATILASMDQLPSVPQIYQELRTALEGEHATWRTVGAVIQKDVGMTAKILKLVNSAFFGLHRRVESPSEAVHYLGMEVVQSLVLAYGLFEQTGPLKTCLIRLEDIWAHSLKVAKGARALAAMEGLTRHQKADAFMGGLLHDAGILILAGQFPEAYDRVIERCQNERIDLPTAEADAFGVTHADVGAFLLGLWDLQAGVLEAVSLHHTPGLPRRSSFDHVLAVHLSDEFTWGNDQHRVWEHTRLDVDTIQTLGLTECIPGWKRILEQPGW